MRFVRLFCPQGQEAERLCPKLDRLSRSLLDFAALMERSRAKGWALVALDLGVDTTPAGEMMANILATFSQYERQLISQRTREALAVKRRQGVRLGRGPGLPDAVVQRIVHARARGRTLAAIAAALNADAVPTSQGGRAWYASSVRSVLLTRNGAVGLKGLKTPLSG